MDAVYKDADNDNNGYITFDEFNNIYQTIIAEWIIYIYINYLFLQKFYL